AAVADYLRHGRPRCSTRRVFVRVKAPLRGFVDATAISDIVDRGLKRAGLEPPRKGAHTLRHALACTMLRRGASLIEIGQILRHRNPDTTALYAKVDIAALRALAPARLGLQVAPGGDLARAVRVLPRAASKLTRHDEAGPGVGHVAAQDSARV